MFEQLIRRITDCRSDDGGERPATTPPKENASERNHETETDATGNANLFRCLSCEIVYIAIDKQTCSKCDGSVEQIPSTLHDREVY